MSSFIALPLELRQQIYSYLLPLPPLRTLAKNTASKGSIGVLSSRIWQSRIPTVLLVISHQIRHEVISYHNATIGYLYLPLSEYQPLYFDAKPPFSLLSSRDVSAAARAVATISTAQDREQLRTKFTKALTRHGFQHDPHKSIFAVYELSDPHHNPFKHVALTLPTINRHPHCVFGNFHVESSENMIPLSRAMAHAQALYAVLEALVDRPEQYRITRLTVISGNVFGRRLLYNDALDRDESWNDISSAAIGGGYCDCEGATIEWVNLHDDPYGFYLRLVLDPFAILRGRVDEVQLVLLRSDLHAFGDIKILEPPRDYPSAWERSQDANTVFMMDEVMVYLAQKLGIHESKINWAWEGMEPFELVK